MQVRTSSRIILLSALKAPCWRVLDEMLFILLLGPATALIVPGLRSSLREAPTCSQHRRSLPPLLASKQVEVDNSQPTLRQWAAAESRAVAPLLTLYTLHAVLKRTLDSLGLAFPASIVGMLSGFGVLCAIRRALCAETADALESFFAPACRLFRVWLAAIFAPGLISLPLVMPPLPVRELVTFMFLICGGYACSLATGVLVATQLAPCEDGTSSTSTSTSTSTTTSGVASTPASPLPPPPVYVPFPRSQQRFLAVSALLLLGVHVGCANLAPNLPHLLSNLVLNLGLLATTLGAFSLASTLTPRAVQVYCHPFLQCSAATLLACAAVGSLTGRGWRLVLSSYAAPTTGAGGWLSQLLGACVVSFSLQLYAYRRPLLTRAGQIVGSALLCTFVSMLVSASAARLSGISTVLRLALLPRTTTTALAGELGRLLNVAPAVGLLAAFSTAILALATGKPLLGLLGATDPVVRGIAISSAAHGGAVVAMSDEPEAFPFAVLTMNLSAAAAVLLLSLRPVRALLLAIAGA